MAISRDLYDFALITEADLVDDDRLYIGRPDPSPAGDRDRGIPISELRAWLQPIQSNLSATTDPGATDDSNASYEEGSRWLNNSASPKLWWICTDATPGAAVWDKLSLSEDELGTAALSATTDFEPAGAVSTHEGAADPHPQYAQLSGGAAANFTAMPQVGGDPIVESGGNVDGEWTRWADGSQEVHDAVSTDGAGFITITYPQPFIDANVIPSGNSITSSTDNPLVVKFATIGASSCKIAGCFYNGTGNSYSPFDASIKARGYYK